MFTVHVATIEVATALIFAAMAGALAWTWRTQRLSGALAWWSVCFAAAAVHMLLLLRGHAEAMPILIFLDEIALIIAAFTLFYGFRAFDGRPIRYRGLTAALVGFVAATLIFSPDPAAMAKVGYAIAAFMALACAIAALNSKRAHKGWKALAVTILSLHAGVLAVRTVLSVPLSRVETLTLDDAPELFFITEPMLLPVILGYTLLGLAYESERTAGITAQQTDPLTGLLNRRGLQQWQARAPRSVSLGVIALDVDFFKRVNDKYGHLVGDEVLKSIAVRLSNQRRATDATARMGGEEFVVLLSAVDLVAAADAADRIRGAMEEAPVRTSEGDVAITVSVGVYLLPAGWSQATFDGALKAADKALYQAKDRGRNTVCVADEA